MLKANEISDILEMQLKEVDTKMAFEEVGTVMEVGDGVAHVFGLDNVQANELLEFENGVRGVAMNLEEDNVPIPSSLRSFPDTTPHQSSRKSIGHKNVQGRSNPNGNKRNLSPLGTKHVFVPTPSGNHPYK